MEHLPPVGWADVATKRDLDHLETVLRGELGTEIGNLGRELGSEIGSVRCETAGLRADMQREMRIQGLGIITAHATFTGIAVALLSQLL